VIINYFNEEKGIKKKLN